MTHDRPCSECLHSRKLIGGWICRKHLMAITADMHVSYGEGTPLCFEAKESALHDEAGKPVRSEAKPPPPIPNTKEVDQ